MLEVHEEYGARAGSMLEKILRMEAEPQILYTGLTLALTLTLTIMGG